MVDDLVLQEEKLLAAIKNLENYGIEDGQNHLKFKEMKETDDKILKSILESMSTKMQELEQELLMTELKVDQLRNTSSGNIEFDAERVSRQLQKLHDSTKELQIDWYKERGRRISKSTSTAEYRENSETAYYDRVDQMIELQYQLDLIKSNSSSTDRRDENLQDSSQRRKDELCELSNDRIHELDVIKYSMDTETDRIPAYITRIEKVKEQLTSLTHQAGKDKTLTLDTHTDYKETNSNHTKSMFEETEPVIDKNPSDTIS